MNFILKKILIKLKGFKLKHFEEAFTSESWIVRIYRVKKRGNRDNLFIRNKNLKNFPENKVIKEMGIFRSHKYQNKIKELKKKVQSEL